MSEKRLQGRIVNKHDTEANWLKATNFIPMLGEAIVYDPDAAYPYARQKIGDGVTNVNDLPFVHVHGDWTQNDENAADYVKGRTHYDFKSIEVLFDGTINLPLGTITTVAEMPYNIVGENPDLSLISAYFDGDPCTIQYMYAASGRWDFYNPSGVKVFTIWDEGQSSGTGSDCCVQFGAGSGAHTVLITKINDAVKQLDEKYIPDTIARTEDLLPTTTEAHQQLVTDADGNAVWEDRLAWEYINETMLLSADNPTENLSWDAMQDQYYGYIDLIDGVGGAFVAGETYAYRITLKNGNVVEGEAVASNRGVIYLSENHDVFCGMYLNQFSESRYVLRASVTIPDIRGSISNLTVTHVDSELKQLDEKYIPDTIARNSDIMQSDWNETDETSMAYIINKPDFVAITDDQIDEIFNATIVAASEVMF